MPIQPLGPQILALKLKQEGELQGDVNKRYLDAVKERIHKAKKGKVKNESAGTAKEKS